MNPHPVRAGCGFWWKGTTKPPPKVKQKEMKGTTMKAIELELAKKNAVVVARVSSSGQTDNTSFETQFMAAKKKADEMGLNVVRYYEETASGASYLTRTETQKALSDLESGLAKNIIFYDFSRFSRDGEYQMVMKKRIEACGGKLILCSGDFADNAEGDLAFGIFGTFAEYERKKIAERCANGRQRRLDNGDMVYRTNPAFGYHIVKKDDVLKGIYPPELLGKYIIIESEAEWVVKVFELYAFGHSVNYIAKFLFDSGVRTKKGGVFNRKDITKIINRTAYKGLAAANKKKRLRDESRIREGKSVYYSVQTDESEWTYFKCPAIVSEELWNAANERLAAGHRNSGRSERKHLLSGMLFCPQCGRRLSGRFRTRKERNNKTDIVYYCSYSTPSNLTKRCDEKRAFNAAKIVNLVTEALILVTTRQEMLERLYEEYAADNSSDEARLENLQGQLKQLEKKESIAANKMMEAEMEGLSSSVWANMIRDLSVQKTAIQNQIKEVEVLVQSKSLHREKADLINEIIADVVTVLEDTEVLTTAEKHRVLSNIIERIEVVESVERGIIMKLKHDGQETLIVQNVDGKVEMAIYQPEFDDFDGESDDMKSVSCFSLKTNYTKLG